MLTFVGKQIAAVTLRKLDETIQTADLSKKQTINES
jgi:hypothetical protein